MPSTPAPRDPAVPSAPRTPVPRAWALVAVALTTLAALSPLFLHHARRVQVDASMDVFFGADQRSRESFEKLESMLTDRVACLVLARVDDLFSDAGADLVHRMGAALAELDGIPSVHTLTRARRPVRKAGFTLDPRKSIEFQPYLPRDGRSAEEWEAIRAEILDFPWSRDLIVSADGRWAMLIAEIERPLPDHAARVALRAEVEAALAPFRDEVLELHYGGFPFIEAEVRDDVARDVVRFLVALPVLLAVVLLLAFRSLPVFLAVLAFEVAGVGFLPVLVNWNGTTLNLYSAILLPLVAGLQLTFLTHLLAALRWGGRSGLAPSEALRAALRHVVRPAGVAALTTGIGLLSLLTCDVGLVREFGTLGAQAVLAAFLVTFVPIALLARLGGGERGRRVPHPQGAAEGFRAANVAGERAVPRLLAASARRPRAVAAVGAVAVVATLPALGLLRTDLRAIEFLSPASAARTTMERIDTELGGMNLFQLEVDTGRPGGLQELEVLRYLERLEAYARGLEGVTNVYGYAQIYAVMNQIWTRGGPEARHVPEDPGAVTAMGMVVHGERFLFGDELFDSDRRTSTLFVRTHDMAAADYLALLERLVEYAEREAPPGVALDGKQGLHSVLEADRRIVRSQVQSLALCALVVFATLAVLWRSLVTASVAVLVNVPALAAILALHGYGGVPLNSVTVMVGAVVLGIAVDNCIHVLSFWNEERRRGAEAGRAAREVVAKKLGAMVCTWAVLAGGLGLFLFSSFPPVADFGALALLGLTVALVSAVLLLPALLVLLSTRTAVRSAPAPAAEPAGT